MPLVVLQPAGSIAAQAQFDATVSQPVALQSLDEVMHASDRLTLYRLNPGGWVRFWRVRPGSGNRDVRSYNQISAGDVVLFMNKGRIFAVCGVTHVLRNRDLANRLRGLTADSDGDTSELVFALTKPQLTQVPYVALNSALGYQPNFVHRTFTVLDSEKSQLARQVLAQENVQLGNTEQPRSHAQALPWLANDETNTPDALARGLDAQAIGALIASKRLLPPLAIGIFGPWGSGKTHFMSQIELAVARYCRPGSDVFQGRVTQITFNAWHYAEHNLWASLLQHVWSSLDKSPGKDDRALQSALQNVQGARRITEEAEQRVAEANEKVTQARAEFERSQRHYEEATDALNKVSVGDLRSVLRLELVGSDDGEQAQVPEDDSEAQHASLLSRDLREARDALRAAATAAGVPPDFAVSDLASTASSSYGLLTRIVVLGRARPAWRSPLAIGLGLCILVLGSSLVLSKLTQDGRLDSLLAQYGQVLAALAGLAAWFTWAQSLVVRVLAPAEKLRTRIDERVASLEAERGATLADRERAKGAAEREAAAAQAELRAAEEQQDLAAQELTDLNPERLLERYLEERAGSSDYQQYMGLVGLAHRDLTELSKHLGSVVSQGGVDAIERIVLYIDDLDRCSPEAVARVLEAVHLLLALPLFVAVVGVDQRWLDKSLKLANPALLERPGQTTTTSARDYLDKIFHLTFTLPHMSASGAAQLLSQVLAPPDDGVGPGESTPWATERQQAPQGVSYTETEGTRDPDFFPDIEVNEANAVQAINLEARDHRVLRELAPLVAASPRVVVRFLNTYLVVRARFLSEFPMSSLREHSQRQYLDGLAVVSAVLFGVPAIAKVLLQPAGGEALSGTVADWLLEQLPTATDDERTRVEAFLTQSVEVKTLPALILNEWLSIALPYTTFALGGPA